jgi:hypothetical protein
LSWALFKQGPRTGLLIDVQKGSTRTAIRHRVPSNSDAISSPDFSNTLTRGTEL